MDKRIQEIDLLRFVAALAVMLFHYSMNFSDVNWARPVTKFGFLGVELFFMISGFVIAYTAFNKTASQFVISRVSRLYPTFWICVLITTSILTLAGQHIGLGMLLANLSMIPSAVGQPMIDTVYWTLFCEIKFYFLMFLLIVLRQTQKIERWLAVWLAFDMAHFLIPSNVLNSLTIAGYATFFVAGTTLYLIRKNGPTLGRLLLLTASLLLAIDEVYSVQVTFTRDSAAGVVACVLMALIYCLFYGVAVQKIRLPDLSVWATLGAMTYPLYLVHAEAGQGLRLLLPPGWIEPVKTLVLTVFSFAIAAVLAYFVEMRLCGKLNKALTRRFSQLVQPA